MVDIHKQLTIYLSLLVIAHRRLALSILLLFIGAVTIWVISSRGSKAKEQHTMADPKTPTPITRTSSSSSTSSSDLLLPTHNPTHQAEPESSKRSSSWPTAPAPIPWRPSWGFLEQQQGMQEPLPQAHQQEPSSSSSVPTSNNNNTAHYLTLPPTIRRTGSMEARKGSSACNNFPEDGLQGFGESRRGNSWDLDLQAGHARGSGSGSNDGELKEEVGKGSGSELAGVGGQFP